MRRDNGKAAKLLFESLRGIVFLGTPHLRERNKREWKNAVTILELRMLSPPAVLSAKQELQQLCEWSREFEDLSLDVRILSTKEGQKSKKKRSMKTMRSESVYIVVRKIT